MSRGGQDTFAAVPPPAAGGPFLRRPPRPSPPSFQRPLSRRRKPAATATSAGVATANKDNFLQKLVLREHFGQIRSRRRPVHHEASTRLFTTSLPARLAFCLTEIAPISAIEAGHIFLGFTKCGQFLLSYTQTSADIEIADSGHMDYNQYNYRLHWWLFVPSRKAKKVAEVMLFSNQGAYGNLHMSFCQWSNDMSKVVIYGHVPSESDWMMQESSSKPCYLTVTAVPSLKACKDCIKVAASYEEEDVAEAWNTCIRLSCLEHGLTIHSTFDCVPPYPMFEPRVNLKRDGSIIINTGNLLHSLCVQLETLGPTVTPVEQPCPSSFLHLQSSPKVRWSELNVGSGELTLAGGEVFSPSPQHPMAHYSTATSDSETTDCESDCGFGRQRQGDRARIHNEERLETVAQFVDQLTSPRKNLRRRLLSHQPVHQHDIFAGSEDAFGSSSSSNSFSSSRKRMAAEKAYELTDDDFHDGVKEKLSTFRKKRLAEKTYEFKDEDSENMTPLPRLRCHERLEANVVSASTDQSSIVAAEDGIVPCVKSPRWTDSSEENVLRPISANQPANSEKSGAPGQSIFDDLHCASSDSEMSNIVPELSSPSTVTRREQQAMFSPRSTSSSNHHHYKQPPPRFHAKFTRRFIEMDDELVSVITDIEDDEVGYHTTTTGYHTALPLDVHGSGYQALSMISNSKAGKLTGRCIKVTQRSFDLEVFCHHMAQKLCQAANMKYWFCNDYDVEIIDMDPESGDVIFVAVVLVQATMSIKKVASVVCSSHLYHPLESPKQQPRLQQHQYQAYEASFKFSWNIDSAQCSVIDSEPLREASPYDLPLVGPWHPAKDISQALQKTWNVMAASKVKCLTNDAVIRGISLRTIVDSDHLVAIIHDHHAD